MFRLARRKHKILENEKTRRASRAIPVVTNRDGSDRVRCAVRTPLPPPPPPPLPRPLASRSGPGLVREQAAQRVVDAVHHVRAGRRPARAVRRSQRPRRVVRRGVHQPLSVLVPARTVDRGLRTRGPARRHPSLFRNRRNGSRSPEFGRKCLRGSPWQPKREPRRTDRRTAVTSRF